MKHTLNSKELPSGKHKWIPLFAVYTKPILFQSNLFCSLFTHKTRLQYQMRNFPQSANTALEVFSLGFGPLFCHLVKWFPDESFLLMP